MNHKILIVEDESLVALEISSALKKEKYFITSIVDNAEDAILSIQKDMPDLVMMDININGDTNGIEASHIIKYDYNLPIIFLTAYNDKKTIDDAIKSAPAGYLIKPFKRQELYACVSLSISKSSKILPELIEFSKECIYNPSASELQKNSQIITLTKKEKQLLDLLLTSKNKVVLFETIEYEIWSDKNVPATTRRTLIHRLREKIGADIIQTKKDQGCILKI